MLPIRFKNLRLLFFRKLTGYCSKNLALLFLGCYLLLCSHSPLYAQTHALTLSANGTYLMPHHKKMMHLNQKHFLFFEASYLTKMSGSKLWHSLYNYPEAGVACHYNGFGGSHVLGRAFAVYPYIHNTFIKSEDVSLSFRFGAGLAWLTQKFDPLLNPTQVAISTNLNICINMSLECKQNLFSNIQAFQSLGVNHYSNGAIKMPNTGINLPFVTAGFKYFIQNQPPPNKTLYKDSLSSKKVFFTAFAAGGAKELYPPCGKLYPAASLSFASHYTLSPKRNINLGLDFFYSNGSAESLREKNLPENFFNGFKGGLSIAHNLVFDRTSFLFATGAYLYNNDDTDGRIYNRIGFRYNATNSLFFNLTLKSHLFVADYLEWGTGINF